MSITAFSPLALAKSKKKKGKKQQLEKRPGHCQGSSPGSLTYAASALTYEPLGVVTITTCFQQQHTRDW